MSSREGIDLGTICPAARAGRVSEPGATEGRGPGPDDELEGLAVRLLELGGSHAPRARQSACVVARRRATPAAVRFLA